MILQIALGIVLAVIILNFWEVILSLGLILMVTAIVLLVAILWAVSDSGSLGILIAVAGGTSLIAWWLESRNALEVRSTAAHSNASHIFRSQFVIL